ncbi:MAG: hypothetical protein JWM11_6627 [Planctomycetaceae bacterium]|nr:hypothetical protein [Planctomycetaceae bacterium]
MRSACRLHKMSLFQLSFFQRKIAFAATNIPFATLIPAMKRLILYQVRHKLRWRGAGVHHIILS